MAILSIPAFRSVMQVATDIGYCYVRLPFLGEAVIVFCVAKHRSRPCCAYHRAAQAGWRTVWLGKLQISHNFR